MIFIVIILSFFSSLYAQDYRFEQLSLAQGISHSSVISILQDRQGFLWVGTWGGLNRYDGYTFKQFKHLNYDSASLGNDNIINLVPSGENEILAMLVGGGYSRVDTKRGKIIANIGTPGSELNDIAAGKYAVVCSGSVFVQSNNGVLKIAADGSYSVVPGLPAKGKLWKENEDAFWVFSSDAIVQYSIKTGQIKTNAIPFSFRKNFELHTAANVIPLNDSLFLFGTLQPGMYCYNKVSGKVTLGEDYFGVRFVSSLKLITSMLMDKTGKIWIGGEEGIVVLNKSAVGYRVTTIKHIIGKPNSLTFGRVQCIFEDRTGIVWVGTSTGLNKYNPTNALFGRFPSFPGNYAMPFAYYETSRGLWWGTTGGLFYHDFKTGKEVRYTKNNSKLRTDYIYMFYASQAGEVYAGGNGGIYLLPIDGVGKPPEPVQLNIKGESSTGFFGMAEDSKGTLWLASTNGLYEYSRKNKSTQLMTPPAEWFRLGNPGMLAVFQRNDSMLYLAADNEGLLLFNIKTKKFTGIRKAGNDSLSLTNSKILSFYSDRKNRLWCVTLGGGLLRIFDESNKLYFKSFTSKQGFPDDTMYGILEDSMGELWISCNKGIVRFNPDTFSIVNYTVADGLPSDESNQSAFFSGRSGRFYFGTINGSFSFYPAQIRSNETAPPVALIKMLIKNEDKSGLLFEKNISLNYTQNFVSFEFTALDFTAPAKNRYAYKLDGVDEDWVYSGDRRFANYTDLTPGEYTFRVKAANSSGVWNTSGTAFAFTIVPPFWATLWFRVTSLVFVIALFAGIIVFAVRQKYRKQIELLERRRLIQEERGKLRDKIARDLHDELASTVGGAGLYVETAKGQLKENPELSRHYLDKSEELIREAEEAMSNIVWSVSPRYDNLADLVSRIHILNGDVCGAAAIEYSSSVSEITALEIDPEFRQQIFAIFKESINNVIKHSSATRVVFTATLNAGKLFLSLKDNGKGFSPDAPSKSKNGNGLMNMKSRAADIKAVLDIITNEQGTGISLTADLTRLGYILPDKP